MNNFVIQFRQFGIGYSMRVIPKRNFYLFSLKYSHFDCSLYPIWYFRGGGILL